MKLVEEFKVYKTTTTFKINAVKLIDKYPKLMKSSMTLGLLKNCYKDIKEICNKNPSELNSEESSV